MSKYRVAVIGRTGKGNYGHGLDTVWLKCDRAEIVAVADENESRPRRGGQAARAPRTPTPTTAQMLDKEKPQIVSVADRWPDCHRDMVDRLCRGRGQHLPRKAGRPARSQQADEMIAACEKHHVKCAIAHQTRVQPAREGRQGPDRDGQDRRRAGASRPRQGGQARRRRRPDGPRHAHLRPDAAPRRRREVVLRPHPARTAARPSPATCGQAASRSAPIVGDHITATYGFDGLATGSVRHPRREGRRRQPLLARSPRHEGRRFSSASASCRPRSCARTRAACFGQDEDRRGRRSRRPASASRSRSTPRRSTTATS